MENINKNRLKVVYGDCTLGVSGEGFSYIFSYVTGGMESLVKEGWSGCIVAQSLHFGEHLQIMTEDVAFI